MFLRSLATASCTAILAVASFAQMGDMKMDKPDASKPMPSPKANALVLLHGKQVTIDYNSPRMRGRTIMGSLVPYDKVWRTGANPATTLTTPINLKIGTLDVPAGTYTLFTVPGASRWQLIVSKDTGEWGLAYKEDKDLGRTPMTGKTLAAPQENMTITFEHNSANSAELHIKWEKTDEFVTVTAQ